MLRLMIVVPIYAFVVIFLPRQPDIARLLEPLLRVYPITAFYLSLGALAICGPLLWLFRREPEGWLLKNPVWWMQVLFVGLIGLFFAGIFAVFEHMSGAVASVVTLVIIPVAFMVAEGIYLALEP